METSNPLSDKFFTLPQEEQIASFTVFAREILNDYGFGACTLESVNYEFNISFCVTDSEGKKFALRININSTRTLANTEAEIAWVNDLQERPGILVGRPVRIKALTNSPQSSSGFVHQKLHRDSGRLLTAVLLTWVEGEELEDEPTDEQILAMGKTMAHLHDSSSDFNLPAGCELTRFDHPFWGTADCLFHNSSSLPLETKPLLEKAFTRITGVVNEMYAANESKIQIIHADMHGGNVIWSDERARTGEGLAVIDFDDCGYGLLVQDISIALYYFDTPEQDALFLKGYESVRALPKYSEFEMNSLLLHRRFMLLNYLYETSNQEHQAMIPDYLAETVRRVEKYLAIPK